MTNLESFFSDASVASFLEKAVADPGQSLHGRNVADVTPAFRAVIREAIGRVNAQRGANAISENSPATDQLLGEIRLALYDTTNVGFMDVIQNAAGEEVPVRRANIVEQALQFVERAWNT